MCLNVVSEIHYREIDLIPSLIVCSIRKEVGVGYNIFLLLNSFFLFIFKHVSKYSVAPGARKIAYKVIPR